MDFLAELSTTQAAKSLVYPLLLLCLSVIWYYYAIYSDRKKNLLDIPGPTPLPLIGNANLVNVPSNQFLKAVEKILVSYGKDGIVRFHIGTRVNLGIATPEAFEKIMSSNKQITKGRDYEFLWSWLGTGLLTSTGKKWHTRRKLLTPAFHFKILEDFMQVMNQQAKIFCGKLEQKVGGQEFDIYPLVTYCALDIICETAMGKQINSQENSDTPYVKAVYRAEENAFLRQRSPWLWNDTLYGLTPLGMSANKDLKILHNFTDKVIQDRKLEHEARNEDTDQDVDNDVGQKKRIAFLDLLIQESKGGTVLTDQDIREEVDTFMFEGHDTTAANITFTLFLLASHPDVQRKCQAELDEIFGGSERPATSEDLASMKYLESCLKESLRLFPSVPFMSRRTGEDLEIDGYHIPANTNVIMAEFLMQRSEKSFPNPNTFDPERFSGGNTQPRHPYAYVPFSAGPRNCIGQKFAMMEEKIIVSSVLRSFNLQTHEKMNEIPLLAEIVLKPENGIKLTVTKR